MKTQGIVTKVACACMCASMLTGCAIVDIMAETADDPSCSDFSTNQVQVNLLTEEDVYAEINQPIKIQGTTAFVATGIVDSTDGCYAMFNIDKNDDTFDDLEIYLSDKEGGVFGCNTRMQVGDKYRLGFACDAPRNGEIIVEGTPEARVHITYAEVIEKSESEETDT